jgi:6-phosphogluconolactonase
MMPEVRSYAHLEELSRAAAEETLRCARAAIAKKDRLTLVLAGGSTPRRLYQILAEEYRNQIDWSKVHLFWSDERFVPLTDSECNFAMASQALISRVRIPRENVHRIPVDLAIPEEAANAYESQLREFFKIDAENAFPGFDLVLLGVGQDGHTASLFPSTPILREERRWVASVTAPKNFKTRSRITLTLPVLNNAEKIFFLVAGAEKQNVVGSILKTPSTAQKIYPAALIRPQGQIIWFIGHTAGKAININLSPSSSIIE